MDKVKAEPPSSPENPPAPQVSVQSKSTQSCCSLPCCSKTLLIPIILAVVLVLGVGYLVGVKFLFPQVPPVVSPQITLTPTPNPTANWKTYRSDKYGFEFRYPIEWRADENGHYPFVQLQEVKDGKVVAVTGGITIIDKATSSTYSTYVKMLASNTKCPAKAGSIDLSDTVNVYCFTGKDIQTSVGTWKGAVECSASQFYSLEVDPETCPHQFWTDTKDFFYIVHFNFFQPIVEGSKEEILFDQILSTFKFLD